MTYAHPCQCFASVSVIFVPYPMLAAAGVAVGLAFVPAVAAEAVTTMKTTAAAAAAAKFAKASILLFLSAAAAQAGCHHVLRKLRLLGHGLGPSLWSNLRPGLIPVVRMPMLPPLAPVV